MINVHSPALRGHALSLFSGGRSALRAVNRQIDHHPSISFSNDEGVLAVLMFVYWRKKRVELCLLINPNVGASYRYIVRFAQLTLRKMLENGEIVFCNVSTLNTQGRKMARMVGFEESRLKNKSILTFRG